MRSLARRLALAALLILLASFARAAGTVTVAEVTYSSVKKITFAWTSTAGGAATATTTAAYDGKVIGLTTIPSGGGTAPTAGYAVVVNDADSNDVLLGAGANRSATNTENVAEASVGAVAGSKLSLSVSGAGNAKQGTVIIWIR